MNRRSFLQTSALAAAFLGLRTMAHADPVSRVIEAYGPLILDPKGLLDLPEGFSYKLLSQAGGKMTDGYTVPGTFDGMAAFPGENGRVILVRNHELSPSGAGPGELSPEARELCYDFGEGDEKPHIGGTTTLVFNPTTGELEAEFLSLTGTFRNCAGGAMPWGSWITCEEPSDLLELRNRKHGYCFEVKATMAPGLQKAEPLRALGRYNHEAVALDPRTGILYLTEDRGDGLLYRFLPEKKGDFTAGRLQALSVVGRPGLDLRNYEAANVGNHLREGQAMAVAWIDLEDIDAPNDDLRKRGAKAGAAVFARGEGIHYHEGTAYICCTDGGPQRRGQIFKLTPSESTAGGDQLELFIEATKSDLLTNGDNLCAAPWGDLVVCEDFAVAEAGPFPCLRGVTPEGRIYPIARNMKSASELAGSCFSPDGKWLFVNVQNPGNTFAITGPWEKRRV
ncbi:MAG TPA: alkaline phosphatase PhoX [Chthoniobacterales bacterium]